MSRVLFGVIAFGSAFGVVLPFYWRPPVEGKCPIEAPSMSQTVDVRIPVDFEALATVLDLSTRVG